MVTDLDISVFLAELVSVEPLLQTTSGMVSGNYQLLGNARVSTEHLIQVRRHLEDWLHHLRAARGQGVLQLHGDGAGLSGHSRQAE